MAILNNIVFCIVTYKEHYKSCDSYTSLINSYKFFNYGLNLNIFVYDNTPDNKPQFLEELSDNIFLKYASDGKNMGLAYAYNYFGKLAKANNFDQIVLLDQDTTLPDTFYKSYMDMDNHHGIACPRVVANNNLMSPSKYINFRSYLLDLDIDQTELNLNKISFINSGMMIDVKLFDRIGGYNQNLFLDFCDHDFIIKASSKINKVGIIDCTLNQDFSATSNSKEQALFRYKFFIRDLVIFYKEKCKVKIFFNVDLPRLLKLTYQYKSLQFFQIRILRFVKKVDI